jgi:nucleoside-diphosphate-sugar epimerase
MEIVGSGFLAGWLGKITTAHPGTVVLAAGVSGTSGSPEAAFAREVAMVRNVTESCRRTGRKVVFLSTASASVYGTDPPGRESEPAEPRNPYGAHKLGLEDWLRDSGAEYLVLRLGHVVGPGQPAHQLVPTLVRFLRAGTITLHHAATRDLIGVQDLILLVDELLKLEPWGETVNVASGAAVPIERIVDHLELRLGVSAQRNQIDGGSAHVVSIDKLLTLLPRAAGLGFGPGYHRGVLDSYLAAITANR